MFCRVRGTDARRSAGHVSLAVIALGSICVAGAVEAQNAAPPAYIWIEGEKPSASTVPVEPAGWGNKQFLSGETWGQINIEDKQVEAKIPEVGVTIGYDFEAQRSGAHEVWARIGYEFARSPFEWRVDNGAWKTVSPDDLTTDLMALADWNEVAWLQLGSAPLTPGKHTLEFRLTRRKTKEGKTDRILWALDALCLTSGSFSPNSRYKPDETGRTPDDEVAARHTFAFPDAPTGARTTLPLAGQWEVCRDDEPLPPFDIAQPMQSLPASPRWRALAVPSDKNNRADLTLAHRLWYRTRVRVPASYAGQAFFLTFPLNSLNTTVYVNGQLVGFSKNPLVRYQVDVSKALKPGQENEIRVGIRDAWYGYSGNPKDPMKLRRTFNRPLEFTKKGFQDLAYPVWGAFQSGILDTPTLTSAGAVYAADVFVKPRVAKKDLTADLTLTNTTSAAQTGTISVAAVDEKTGQTVKTWDGGKVSLVAGETKTVPFSGAWNDAKLWWPDPNPQLYRLRVTVKGDGTVPADTSDTVFGFREWGTRGRDFTLNGQVWHGWADLNAGTDADAWLQNYRKTGQRFMRLSGVTQNGGVRWKGKTFDETLDFFDRSGVNVRRSGVLDGEAIGYMAIETDPDLKALYKSEIKQQLMDNWRDQMVAQVKGERNHPSIMLWSVENEWLYINCINLYPNLMDEFEREVKRCMDAVAVADPTRLSMTDGGGAGKDQLFPVHGDHYVFSDKESGKYPALAYEANPTGGGRGRWVWDQKRPRFMGEDYFATGINPADYAPFGGEETFQGKTAARPAAGLIQRMLTEGYRWAGHGAFHFWIGSETAVNQYQAFAPLAVFCREWDSTFAAGQTVPRTLGIFNDTHDPAPVTLKQTLVIGGKTVSTQTATHTVPPGTNKKFNVDLALPQTAKSRVEGTWTLTLSRNGRDVFRDVRPVSVLSPRASSSARLARGAASADASRLASTNAGMPLALYDPKGDAAKFLTAQGCRFQRIGSLDNLPALKTKVLLVGRDALTEAESGSSRLAAWASGGHTVIVLEQAHPLRYQGVPADMGSAQNEGRTGFAEDENHPVFAGLRQRDLFTWGKKEVVYRDAYEKPTRGAKSLVQCDTRLSRTALVEVPTGRGLLLLSQLTIGENLGTVAPAQQLLFNLLAYGTRYKQEFRPVTLATRDAAQLQTVLDATGIRYQKTSDLLKALTTAGGIAIMEATPANLAILAAHRAAVDTFNRNGGFLVLSGLTPEGLAAYNKIVGVPHLIRPFRRERVAFPARRHPLTAGLSNADIVLSSGERINGFTDDVYTASDVFRYVVDYDDVAPFATLPPPSYWNNTDASNDHNPYNIVNGFTSADGWQLIFSMWAGPGGHPDIPLKLPVAQEITRLEWTGNTFYYPTKKVELVFDGRDKVSFTTQPNNETQTFPLKPGLRGKEITVKIAEWEKVKDTPIVGVDNLRLFAKRPASFYQTVHPLLNIGALMAYDRGKGGIVLCNLLFQAQESVAENKRKKQNIFATLLRNLKAPTTGGASIIAGQTLTYSPLDISRQATQYRDERGWFGDKNFTFGALPTGKQSFAGVPFSVYQFPTSPVPTAVMLGGPNVPGNLPDAVRGIGINRKADALFFLHTARLDQRRNAQEIRDNKQFEMARYVVTYADGQRVTVPLYAETDLDDFRQETPRSLPGAQIGWTRKYEGTPYSAVAYVKQWNNSRPQVAIQSVDLEYGPDRRGVPVLLALTAASANQKP